MRRTDVRTAIIITCKEDRRLAYRRSFRITNGGRLLMMSELTVSTEHRRLNRNGGSFFHFPGERRTCSRKGSSVSSSPLKIMSATAVMNEEGILLQFNALLLLYISLLCSLFFSYLSLSLSPR